MRTVLYPGSFDPVTAGHMDLIRRAAALFDRVIIGVLHNPQKLSGAFPVAERIRLLETAAQGLENVSVAAFTGMLVEAARACGADAVMRGVRTTADIENELQMARLNRQIGGVETLLLAASPETVHISSSMAREVGRLGGDLRGMVPECIRPQVALALLQKD